MINSNDEFAIIVDEQDKVLGYKKRGELHPHDRIRVTGVWLENTRGEVLIAQRSFKKDLHPGLWGPAAAGGVAKGESYEENAYKELEEEIGLTGIDLTLADKAVVEYTDGTRRVVCWFRGKYDGPAESLVLEDAVESVKWVAKSWLRKDLLEHPEHYVPSAVQHWERIFLSS